MNERSLRKALTDTPLGELRYYERISSTNDVALTWATEGAPDLSLVYAEEQTAGRGRGTRRWLTPPGAGLAFSLILRPRPGEDRFIPRFSALGALSVTDALQSLKLASEIKWPNDVLVRRRKVCGILVEMVWVGEAVDSLVLGIGINVLPEAVPSPEQLIFPATCLEAEIGRKVKRPALLRDILRSLLYWRTQISTEAFFRTWDQRLAFRGEQVEVWTEEMPHQIGCLAGLEEDGSLRLQPSEGNAFPVAFGDVHLRPVV